MKEELMDRIINDKFENLKENKLDNIEVPSVFHNCIEDTLTSLENIKPKKKNNKKKQVIAAAITITCLTGIAFSVPTLAKNIPAINNILNGKSVFDPKEKNPYNFGLDNTNLKEYTNQVNQSIKSGGITITVKEVAYDGNKVFLGYIIQGEKDILMDSSGKAPDVFPGHSTTIDGKRPSSGGYDFKKIDNKTYVMREEIDISPSNSIPDKFRFTTKFRLVSGIKGVWDFDFIVSQENFKNKCKTIPVRKHFNIDNNKFTIEKLSLTPLSSVLNMTDKRTGLNNLFNKTDNSFFNDHQILVTNEKGYSLKIPGSNWKSDKNYSEAQIEFVPEEINTAKSINIKVLKKSIDFIQPKECKIKYEVPIKNTSFPKKITTKRFGSIIINKINTADNKLTLKFKLEGDYSPLLLENIWLWNSKKDFNDESAYKVFSFNRKFVDGEYIIEESVGKDFISDYKDLKIVISDPSEYYEPLEECNTEVIIN
ncbi:DUF4179 domain-containing protein [Clostridium tetanomorphum]|uniref:DUF4179 domain-containing protein n=1 Tax=Clostridium tetanomorphum TaxID=1553 RepID=A0A923EAC1_CLOTT|nr:DUF4179 domain-containing protein [Clostridium tetanomorphum]MBC2398029.1 DUF4179 domain-containing protein [Clostridium tetanomorphum]NRZ98897.1 hypothetical protein [Clostridium tetanomorphum]